MATGVGIALAAAPAAVADEGAAPAAGSQQDLPPRSGSAERAVQRGAAAAQRSRAAYHANRSAAAVAASPTVATATGDRRPAIAAPRIRAERAGVEFGEKSASVASATSTAQQTGIIGQVAAFFGLPGAPATTDPTISSVPLYLRLVVDDLIGGSTPPPTVDPATVITGLFREMLRQNPTPAELQTYGGIWGLTGINGVVAGLYSSTAFRQQVVNNYYLELLNRNASAEELSWDAFRLQWGLTEPLLAAGIAGTDEFYASSSAGGGPDGYSPTATTFVNLLYRSLVGTTPDPVVAPTYIQQVQAGRPTGRVSMEFVTDDPFRQVKVLETFEVLGLSPTPVVINDLVDNWFWYGGLSGISTLLLASGENAVRIQQGLVQLPDMVAAAQMQQLLLAPYDEAATGFVNLFETLFGDPTADDNCRKSPATCANPGLYELLTTGGVDRGIPNSAIDIKEINAPVADLIPTQNEISLKSSLGFPLTSADTLRSYFEGGDVKVAKRLILTAGGGSYVVDGHHRWSQLFLINPFANIVTADVGYVPNPKESLRQTQIAIAAQTGFFKPEDASTDNLYTISRADFDTQVAAIINGQSLFEKTRVLDVFTEYLALDGQTDDEKIASIQDYIWGNVERMREMNYFVTDATGRPFMPQTPGRDFQSVLNYMDGPSPLSYSFPIISYIG